MVKQCIIFNISMVQTATSNAPTAGEHTVRAPTIMQKAGRAMLKPAHLAHDDVVNRLNFLERRYIGGGNVSRVLDVGNHDGVVAASQ